MADAKEVAEWMKQQFDRSSYLYQESTVYQIKKLFGDDFVYQNDNGNLAIDKNVLKEFRTITEGEVTWERGDKAWRKLRDGEVLNGRQSD